MATGDLGRSWITGGPVGPGLFAALGVSLTLMGVALVVATLVASLLLIAPMVAGLRFRPNRGSGLVAALVASVPSFLLAAGLLVVVSVWWGLLPPSGWRGPHFAVLPALAMGVPAGAYLGRLLAEAVTGVWSEAWVKSWALAGATRRRLCGAVLRRGLGSVVSQIGLVMVGLTAEAVAVEQVFAIPGLGRALLGAASSQDIPATQAGLLLLLAVAVLVGVGTSVARRLLVGAALASGSVPVPRPLGGAGKRARVVSITAFAVLVAVVCVGLPRDPFAPVDGRLTPPSASLLFGADATGRDLLARVAHGAVSTVGGAALVTLLTFALGMLLGLLGRWSTGLIEVANALPSIIVGLVITALWGPSLAGAVAATAITAWAPLAAHTRDLVAEVRGRPYVKLQPLWGVGPARQLIVHVIPEVAGAVGRHAVLRLPGRALELASLGFRGLGPRPPAPDWGLLLAEGIQYVERAPWTVLAPTGALMLASVSAVAMAAAAGRRGAVADPG